MISPEVPAHWNPTAACAEGHWVDLPPGSILLPPGGSLGGAGSKTTYEITEGSVASDQKNLVYYIQTYDNPGLRSLNFDQLPLDGGTIKVMPLNQPLHVTVLSPS